MAKPESSLDPGPPEAHFSLEPSELRDETEKELRHLRQDKARLEGQLQAAREQVGQMKDGCFEGADLLLFNLVNACILSVGTLPCVHTSLMKLNSICFVSSELE